MFSRVIPQLTRKGLCPIARPGMNLMKQQTRTFSSLSELVDKKHNRAKSFSNLAGLERSLVLTFSGPDKTGIVFELSNVVHTQKGNVEESRMTLLGQDFALLMLISVDANQADTLKDEITKQFPEFNVSFRDTASKKGFQGPVRILHVTFDGPDQPGVLSAMSNIFLKNQISVRDLETDTSSAPFAGYKVFGLKSVIAVPNSTDLAQLDDDISAFEEEYGVDVTIYDPQNDSDDEQRGRGSGDDESDGDEEEAYQQKLQKLQKYGKSLNK